MESYLNFSVLEWLMHCKEFRLPHVIPSSDSLPTCHTILLLWGLPFIAMCSWQNILDRWEHKRKLWYSGFKRKVHVLSIKTFTVTGHFMTCSVILYAAFQICFFHIWAWENMTGNATSVWRAKQSERKQSHYGSMFYTCIRWTHGVWHDLLQHILAIWRLCFRPGHCCNKYCTLGLFLGWILTQSPAQPHKEPHSTIINNWFLEPEWAIDSEAMRARGIIVLIKSN